jgi:LAS superfamily LD-carboxypeptidase LdcB
MSIFDFILDPVKSLIGMPTSKDVDKQKKEMNAQIKAYNEQTKIAKEEQSRLKDEQTAEKRRIQEKQIRSLRRSSRSQNVGFLGSSQETQPGQSAKLGG